jgi:curved DNA-binding protein CbpA
MTHYDTLGIAPDADPSTIKAAWRKLAQANHPDKHEGGNTEAYQAIQRAYDVLSDAAKRAHYDATGEEANDGPSLRSQALQTITAVISGAIANLDVKFENILEHTARSIKHTLAQVDEKERDFTARRAKVTEAIRRTSAKGGNADSLAMILAHLDAQLAGPLATIANDRAVMGLALEILAEHEYQVDHRQQQPSNHNDYFFEALRGQYGSGSAAKSSFGF